MASFLQPRFVKVLAGFPLTSQWPRHAPGIHMREDHCRFQVRLLVSLWPCPTSAAGDVPVEDYITYIFDGVLPCLSDYLRMFWDQFTEADAEHLRAIKTIVAELCKLPSVPVPEMTLVHWDMLSVPLWVVYVCVPVYLDVCMLVCAMCQCACVFFPCLCKS